MNAVLRKCPIHERLTEISSGVREWARTPLRTRKECEVGLWPASQRYLPKRFLAIRISASIRVSRRVTHYERSP